MPMYQYSCRCGHVTEDICSFATKCTTLVCEVCGKVATETFSRRLVTGNVETPRGSRAMGVAPHQIEVAMKKWPGSRYSKEGRLLIQNRAEKKVRMKQRGYVEYD